jgi:hypothetical protein
MFDRIHSAFLRLDERLGTRPLFSAVLARGDWSAKDLAIIAVHTVKALTRFHGGRLQRLMAEHFDTILYYRLLGGRIPQTGLQQVHRAGHLSWSQPTSWRAAQRARRALGRVPLEADCTTIYCGFRSEHSKGEPLDMFILTDKKRRVQEIAYLADRDEDGVILVPGYLVLCAPQREVKGALLELQMKLGAQDPEERVRAFYLLDRSA